MRIHVELCAIFLPLLTGLSVSSVFPSVKLAFVECFFVSLIEWGVSFLGLSVSEGFIAMVTDRLFGLIDRVFLLVRWRLLSYEQLTRKLSVGLFSEGFRCWVRPLFRLATAVELFNARGCVMGCSAFIDIFDRLYY